MAAGGRVGRVAIGELRGRATFRSPVRTKGATGQEKVTGWTPVREVAAAVTTGPAAVERFGHDQQYAACPHAVIVRGGFDVPHDWSVLWGTRVLNVKGVVGAGTGPANFLVVYCNEQPPSTP